MRFQISDCEILRETDVAHKCRRRHCATKFHARVNGQQTPSVNGVMLDHCALHVHLRMCFLKTLALNVREVHRYG